MSDLYHHGVKGQKWGVRRKLTQKSESRKREKSWNDKYEKRRDMSTKDLEATVKRLRLENEFGRLVKDVPSRKSSVGKSTMKWAGNLTTSAANDILKDALKKNAGTLVKTAAGYIIKAVVK